MSTPTVRARESVRELTTVVAWLAAALIPGTAKPYQAPQMSAEKRRQRDAEARIEWLERVDIAPGESPVPLDLAVADLLAEILVAADDLAELVADAAGMPRLAPAGSAWADPGPFLTHVLAYLPAAGAAVAERVEDRCDDLIGRAHQQLGLLGDGQILDAVCPWCGGRTSSQPVGGARTMRVRAVLPADGRSVTRVDPKDVRWLVVCEGLCEPPPAECGERFRGRPAWPLRSEGEWLADRLEANAS